LMGSTSGRAHLVQPPPYQGVRRGLPALTGSEGGSSTRSLQDALTPSASEIECKRDRMDAIVNPSQRRAGAESRPNRRSAEPKQTARRDSVRGRKSRRPCPVALRSPAGNSVSPRQPDSCGMGTVSSKQLIPKYRRYLRLIVRSPSFWCNRFMAALKDREQALAGQQETKLLESVHSQHISIKGEKRVI
jgi:hypothetical protein